MGVWLPCWFIISSSSSFETEGRQANARVQEEIGHLASFFCQVERRFHSHGSTCQPLPSNLDNSPLSFSSLGSSRTCWSTINLRICGWLWCFRIQTFVDARFQCHMSLKENCNCWFDTYLRNISIKSSLAHPILKPILNVGWYFGELFFPPLNLWENLKI